MLQPSNNFPAQPAAAPLAAPQLAVLHALRGFSALCVVLFHAKKVLWAGGTRYLAAFPPRTWSVAQAGAFALDTLNSAGYEMVVVFFVLSGFLIRWSSARRRRGPGRFYLNRALRIYPPFLCSMLLAAGALWALAALAPAAVAADAAPPLNHDLRGAWQELQAPTWPGLLRALGFGRVGSYYWGYNEVYWSLLPEALFYLLAPWIFRRLRLYYAATLLLYAAGLAAAWLHLSFSAVADYFLCFNLYFALGIALHDACARTTWLQQLRRITGWQLAMLAAGLFAVMLALAVLRITLASGLVAAAWAGLLISVGVGGRLHRPAWLLSSLGRVGTFSFSLYLYHFPLLLLCYAGLVRWSGRLFVYERVYWLAVPLVVAGSYGLYWLTERVFVRLFRKI